MTTRQRTTSKEQAHDAESALEDGLVAIAVVVAFLGALRAHLGLVALVSLLAVSNLLAVVALFGTVSTFEDRGLAGLPSCICVAVRQESPRIMRPVEVEDHGPCMTPCC